MFLKFLVLGLVYILVVIPQITARPGPGEAFNSVTEHREQRQMEIEQIATGRRKGIRNILKERIKGIKEISKERRKSTKKVLEERRRGIEMILDSQPAVPPVTSFNNQLGELAERLSQTEEALKALQEEILRLKITF